MKIERFKIGDRREISHVITEKDLNDFARLTGDDNALHTDAAFAARTVFKKPVVHGMLSASFISTIIGTKLPGPGALWFSQNLEFLLPVRIGDTIKVSALITKIDKRQGILDLQTQVHNQHNQKVIDGNARVRLIEEKIKVKKSQSPGRRTILIAGASGGIGSALVHALAGGEWNIGMHSFSNEKKVKELQKNLKIKEHSLCLSADLSEENEVIQMCSDVVDRFGRLDAIVNCSTAYVANSEFSKLNWSDFTSHLDVHLKGSFHLVQSALPHMEKNKYGKIVFLTTQAIEFPFSNLTSYISAKSALSGFAKSLALDLGSKGIRVNCVSPGITDTELNADLPEKVKLVTEARTPLGRLAQAEDVAHAIRYMLSPESDFLTGQTIRVNGGQTMI